MFYHVVDGLKCMETSRNNIRNSNDDKKWRIINCEHEQHITVCPRSNNRLNKAKHKIDSKTGTI